LALKLSMFVKFTDCRPGESTWPSGGLVSPVTGRCSASYASTSPGALAGSPPSMRYVVVGEALTSKVSAPLPPFRLSAVTPLYGIGGEVETDEGVTVHVRPPLPASLKVSVGTLRLPGPAPANPSPVRTRALEFAGEIASDTVTGPVDPSPMAMAPAVRVSSSASESSSAAAASEVDA